MTEPLRLLAVFPHPDDETLGLGGVMAKYSAEGVETHLVCATRGERGWFDSEGPDPGLEGVGRIRAAELRCAAKELGLHEVSFLDFLDGDVDQVNPLDAITKIAAHVRRIRPQVVVTFPPDGAYGHPDHIALSQFAAAALVCAADSTFSEPDGLAPHRVQKLYFMIDTQEIVDFATQVFGGISMDVDGVTRKHVGWADWEVTTRVDASPFIETVHRAVHCHKSQLPGYGPLAEMSAAELGKFLGKGNFYRVFSLVNGGRRVEADLFEGLR
jgi:LmbE family N-acetylglucosaminyl deacetylase